MNNIIQEDCARIANLVDLSPFVRKRVLITGATGLIGQYLMSLFHYANEMQALNCSVTGLSLHASRKSVVRLPSSKHVAYKSVDLSKSFKLQGSFDYIFHAAGYGQPAKFIADPRSLLAINIGATETLLEIARKSHGVFCYFSSAEVYGEIPSVSGGINEEYVGGIDTTNARAIYAESKRMGEAISSLYSRTHGVRTKIFRISHLYGPGISIHDSRVLGDFLKGALISKNIALRDDGRAIKTFGYVADAVAMMMHVALYGKDMIYHIGGKDVMAIRDLANEIARQTGVRVIIPSLKSNDPHIGVDPRFVGLSIKKVLREMKKFSLVPITEGLRRTIAWNKQEFKRELSLTSS